MFVPFSRFKYWKNFISRPFDWLSFNAGLVNSH